MGQFSFLGFFRMLIAASVGADAVSGFPVLRQIDHAAVVDSFGTTVASGASLAIAAAVIGVVFGFWFHGGFRARATIFVFVCLALGVGFGVTEPYGEDLGDSLPALLIGAAALWSLVWGGPVTPDKRN